MSLWTARNNV